MRKKPETRVTDKFSGFLAVTPNKKFMKLFDRADVKNILISYHYAKGNKSFTEDIMKDVVNRGGLFMTDSGIFSFLNDPKFDYKTFEWERYVNEYVEWIDKNKEYIFSCVNMDADSFIVQDDIFRWNEDLFEKLERDINVVYGCHMNSMGKGDLDMVEYYSKKYKYIGVGEKFAKYAGEIYQKSKVNKCNVHGLAWTKPTILRDYPFFSVDSSSWVNYQKYGATVYFDGTNFEQYDNKRKDVRVSMKNKCNEYGVKFYEFVNEKNEDDGKHNDDEGLTFSIKTWLDVFEHIKSSAKPKLIRTVGDALKGKITHFEGMKADDKNKNLANRLGTDVYDAQIYDAHAQTYEVDEDGNKVALYEKRNELVNIDDFKEKQGSLMVCNFCSIQEKCPKFKENATCGFDFSTPTENLTPMEIVDKLISIQNERVSRAMFFEKMEGGVPSRVYTQELKTLQDLNNQKISMLMMVQGKGLRLTHTTVEIGGSGVTQKDEKVGFAQILQNMLKKD